MYQALLTRKYLTSKVMPMLAMLAVTLSVATVLVTWSVMGGFLQQLLSSGRTLIGDVTVYWPNTGFPYYDELIEDLEADERIAAAAPTIETFGLIVLPDDRVQGVFMKGFDKRITGVTGYEDTLWWRPLDKPLKDDTKREDPRLATDGFFGEVPWAEKLTQGITLSDERGDPAVVLGMQVSGANKRTKAGTYDPQNLLRASPDGDIERLRVWMPEGRVTLHAMPLDASGRGIEVVTRTLPVANEFTSGIFEVDSRTVLVRLDVLQRMLNMHAENVERVVEGSAGGFEFDPETGELVEMAPEVVGTAPARVTNIVVRAAEGVDAEDAKRACEELYGAFAERHRGEVPSPGAAQFRTWRELNATQIAAVETETTLVLFVFGLISLTASFLVLAIFWSMVSEKTRDIGILRALGAGWPGVAWIWLRYGVVIGLVGGAGGVGAAAVITWRIDDVHDLLTLLRGGQAIWDPAIYYFTEIPTDLTAAKITWVLGAAVLTCVLGSLVPALRAGLMSPVKALAFD